MASTALSSQNHCFQLDLGTLMWKSRKWMNTEKKPETEKKTETEKTPEVSRNLC